jgi:hypothetical protein
MERDRNPFVRIAPMLVDYDDDLIAAMDEVIAALKSAIEDLKTLASDEE